MIFFFGSVVEYILHILERTIKATVWQLTIWCLYDCTYGWNRGVLYNTKVVGMIFNTTSLILDKKNYLH